MSDSATHYSLLTEHHHKAATASRKLEAALVKRAEAEKEIREARRSLSENQNLIDSWYRENEPADPATVDGGQS